MWCCADRGAARLRRALPRPAAIEPGFLALLVGREAEGDAAVVVPGPGPGREGGHELKDVEQEVEHFLVYLRLAWSLELPLIGVSRDYHYAGRVDAVQELVDVLRVLEPLHGYAPELSAFQLAP